MDNSGQVAPIIIIKKKRGHEGHHGGAWKVAYADFVTAMMALFIVLWLLNTNQKVQEAVSGYFKDPKGYKALAGTGAAGTGESLAVDKGDMERLSEKLQQAMSRMPEFQKIKDQVAVTVTGEGLRVELLENEKGVFFESGSPKPNGQGEELIRLMAKELGKLPNDVVIEGHTDSRPFSNELSYGNWELSSDRANAARRLMEGSGTRASQIVQVRGFADRSLRAPDRPEDASNRRVSIIVRYPNQTAAGGGDAAAGYEEAGAQAPAVHKAESVPSSGAHKEGSGTAPGGQGEPRPSSMPEQKRAAVGHH